MQGRKVKVTCKHCGYGIIVDGFAIEPSPPKPAPVESVPAIFDALRVAPEDDATRVMRRPQDFSVHDEPTVIGRIPQEALDAERRFAQRTVPPPKDGEAAPPAAPAPPPAASEPPPTEELLPVSSVPAPPSPVALPHDVPEQPLDQTKAASPSALAAVSSSRSPVPEGSDAKTLFSRVDPPEQPVWPWILGAILIVVVLAALAIRH